MPAECAPWELGCTLGSWVDSVVGDAIENMAAAVSEAVGKLLASLGTMWVNVGTPNLTGGGSSSAVGTPPGVAGLSTVLGYVTWVALALMIVSLFILGAQWAIRMRRGDGGGVGKLGVILGATVLVSAAAALVSAVLPSSPSGGSSTVAFLQGSLWWYVGAAAVLSVIVGATRMAWEQRAEPGRDLLKSLFTLIVVAGASVTVIGLLVTAADAFAVWILNNATSCDVTADACFSTNITALLSIAALGQGSLLVIILGLVAILASAVQILLMVARGGMLVILTGILPLAASATNTEMGKSWFKKALGWLIAFILYKPAAAIVYATAFKLVGTDVFQDDGTGVISVLTGLMLMLVALFAMPALMRFVTPLVAATSSGGGGLAAAGAAGGLVMLPTGAAALGRLSAGHSSTASSGQVGPTGNTGGTGNTGASGSDGSVGSTGTSGPPPPPPGGSAAVGVASRGGGAAAGGGAAGAGAATGSTAAAGAAAGPAGVAGGVALGAAQAVGRAASGTARSVGAEATGEGDGPSGSR